MSKKGYSHRRLHSFVQKMVTNAFDNYQSNYYTTIIFLFAIVSLSHANCKKTKQKKKQQVSESTAPTIPPCTEATISPWLNKIPFTTTVENVPKLEQCLCSNFSSLPLVNHHCSLACLYHLLIFI